ncbi:MAG: hypothetical protein FD144_3897 [Rhodospirillaceae bacterium]|nr:MAG: hypothetical protein FD144_3897 [Rhodospirillaceae bacterium]
MNRLNTIFIALAAAAAVAVFASEAQARSGHALAVAEKACLEQGLKPRSTAFESCVERVADAYDRTGQMPKVTWPTASLGEEGFHALSQARPSRSAI